ncbi:MAG: formamidopyrimidine-DNA glycosylase [Thermomicrobiales bacterium]|nr:formamidopyrimidine-DNA glycosylase [Thermomicrobiales bacterium]
MPELPEVETGRRIVEQELTGRTVSAVTVRLPKLLRLSPIATLDPLVGRTVTGARRRAKVLVIDFSGDLSLMIHLKLAGQLAIHRADGTRRTAGHPIPDPAGTYPHRTTHIELAFDGGTILYLSDVRQFGWLRLLPTQDVEEVWASFAFGPEAVGADLIAPADLAARLSRRTIPIKLALLDQSVLAGLGNIYVDEALHRAKLHPTIPANSLQGDELVRLRDGIVWSLERGLEQGGAKIINNKAYPIDGFPEVHGRAGSPCPVCGATVVKTRVGARGTYLCPICQPEPKAVPVRPSTVKNLAPRAE